MRMAHQGVACKVAVKLSAIQVLIYFIIIYNHINLKLPRAHGQEILILIDIGAGHPSAGAMPAIRA